MSLQSIVSKLRGPKSFSLSSGGGGGLTPGTTPVTGGTAGSVLFVGAGPVVQEDNANFFWDDSTNRLGLGDNSSLGARLHIKSAGNTSTDYTLRIENTTGTILVRAAGNGDFQMDGHVGIGDTPVATRKLYIYDDVASDQGLHVATAGANSTSAILVNSGTGTVTALSLNCFNGTTNYALLINSGDIGFSTGTGSKIAIDPTMKFAFWGKTPIAQPTTGITGATRVGGAGTTVTTTDTFGGYTIEQLAAIIINTGLGA